MAVDLKSNGFFKRLSILIEPDSLIKLEHERTKDRVRKVMFDRVDQIIVWRQLPGVRIAIVAILFGLPGLLLFIPGGVAIVFGVILLVMAMAGIGFYVYCQKTTIRMIRAGRVEDLTGVFWPGKVRRLVSKMVTQVQVTQEEGFARLASKRGPEPAHVAGAFPVEPVEPEGPDPYALPPQNP